MAYVVRRPRGRWEIRESFATPAGPRSRTLASFTMLGAGALQRAQEAAEGPFDKNEIVKAARRLGVPREKPKADALAESLLRELVHGRAPRPGLRRLVHERLAAAGAMPERVDDALADWIGAALHERGTALVDLLGLADHLPRPLKKPLEFPGLSPARLRV